VKIVREVEMFEQKVHNLGGKQSPQQAQTSEQFKRQLARAGADPEAHVVQLQRALPPANETAKAVDHYVDRIRVRQNYADFS
jgi:hypothetical protein